MLGEGENRGRVGRYLEAVGEIERMGRVVRRYPKRAREVARRELGRVEVEVVRGLEGRVEEIIKEIEEKGEIEGEIGEEEEDDFLDTNKVIMTFNIYTQTDT